MAAESITSPSAAASEGIKAPDHVVQGWYTTKTLMLHIIDSPTDHCINDNF